MMWPLIRVGDLVSGGVLALNDGYRVTNRELGPNGIPFVRGGDIGDHGEIETNVSDHVLPEFQDRVATKITRAGDVAFISKGSVGRVGYLRADQPPAVFAPQVCYWRSLDHDRLEPRFIFYLLSNAEFQTNLDAVKTHGSMVADYVSLSDQKLFRLPLPPIEVQRVIVRILGALDDKIELNRKTNETLEAIAHALFKSWFVDGELPAPERVVEDLVVERVLVVGDGYRAKNEELGAEGLPFARAGDVVGGDVSTETERLLPARVPFAGDKISRAGDVVFTSKGTVGRFAFVREGASPVVYSPQLCYWRSVDRGRLQPLYLFHWMMGRAFMEQVDRVKGQTDMADYVSLRDQRRMRVPVPAPEDQHRFVDAVAPIDARIEGGRRESRTLAGIRDALLPKLMSGELRVRDAERAVEAAT